MISFKTKPTRKFSREQSTENSKYCNFEIFRSPFLYFKRKSGDFNRNLSFRTVFSKHTPTWCVQSLIFVNTFQHLVPDLIKLGSHFFIFAYFNCWDGNCNINLNFPDQDIPRSIQAGISKYFLRA